VNALSIMALVAAGIGTIAAVALLAIARRWDRRN
jgi:hypothetical protein